MKKFQKTLMYLAYIIYVLLGTILICDVPAALEDARIHMYQLPDRQSVDNHKSCYFMYYPSKGYMNDTDPPGSHVYYYNKSGESCYKNIFVYLEYWQGKTDYIYKVRTTECEILWLKRERKSEELHEVDINEVNKWHYFPRYRFGSLCYLAELRVLSGCLLPLVYIVCVLLLLIYLAIIAIKKEIGAEIPDSSRMLLIVLGALLIPTCVLFYILLH